MGSKCKGEIPTMRKTLQLKAKKPKILGQPLKEGRPYRYLGHYPSTHTIAKMLKVPEKELQSKKQTRGKTEGFPKKYLEERIHLLAEDGDWDAYMDVLALTIYEIVIFPNANDFLDLASIDIFLAQKSRERQRILCCLPALYVWLTAHIFDRKYKESCPISDFKMLRLKTRNDQEWAQTLANLTEGAIRWYPRWREVHEWVKNRAMEVNLPFSVTIPLDEETSVPIPTDNEELKEVKVKLARVEEEKKELEVQLREIRQAYEALQLENTEKSRSLEKANKRARADREQANKTIGCWLAADEELGLHRQERNKVQVENQHLRELLGNSKIAKREVQKELDNMKQQMQEMVVEYERKIEKEKLETREMVEKYQAIIKKKHKDIQGLLGQLKEKDDVVYQSKREMVF
ncbi:hypothetical protein SESBI_43097 [Sesbania bispinosa]|nr:hypothetical protein SESBI_43097 [Sesbania bispinosa]